MRMSSEQSASSFGTPDTDLFTSYLNNKLDEYFSWRLDPYCAAVNAFSQSWANLHGYAFPPFNLISRVLHKITNSKSCIVTLICPYWPSQPWFPHSAELFVYIPLILPFSPSLLSCLGKLGLVHPLITRSRVRLVACQLSNNSSLQRTFPRKLSKSYSQAGKPRHSRAMTQYSNSGYHFAINNTSVQATLL